MWPYGSIEPPLGEQALTYADRLEAHWRTLPARRKRRVLMYLARRLVRSAAGPFADEFANFGDDLVALFRSVKQSVPEFRKDVVALCQMLEQRLAEIHEDGVRLSRERDFRQAAAREIAGLVGVAFVMFLLLQAVPFRADADRMTIVEAARLAKNMRPYPCYFADGEVWIDDNGTLVRPRDDNYESRLREVCGL